MEQSKGGGGVPERPAIPDILIEATVKAIKAGMKMDEFAVAIQNQETTNVKVVKKQGGRSERRFKGAAARRGEEDEEEPERTFRNLDERRMGFLIIGDQHRFTATGKNAKDRFIYTNSPPLDYSFCMINRIEEIVSENEQPQKLRSPKIPDKTPDDRYQTSCVRMSYNVINELDGLINVLYKILDGGPFGLCWLDLSFNAIAKLDEDTLSQLPHLRILYLHGNSIVDMTEIPKLQGLRALRDLTLHGNPVEQEEGYRISVLFYLPLLLHLDFVAVTKSDKANSENFGTRYERYWEKRHEELEEDYLNRKRAAEISYTEKVMKGGDDSDDEEDYKMLKGKGKK